MLKDSGKEKKMSNITVKIENHIALVTLNNPPLNILSRDYFKEIEKVFDQMGEDDDVYVVILNSAAKHFSAGFEIRELEDLLGKITMAEHNKIVGDSIASIYTCKKPVVAAVNGYAVGGGCALAGAADVIVASDDAQFWIPEIRIGFVGAHEFLKLIVPEKIARYYALTGKRITAQRLYEWGSVLEVVPRERLLETAYRVANELLENSPLILRHFKKAMNINDDAKLLEQFEVECRETEIFTESEDFKEAFTAFLEKRKPQYKNR